MTLGALLAKDARVEWRSRDAFAATTTVALLIALVGNVAFADRVPAVLALPGALWMAIAFAAQVGLARTFVVERDRGTLEGMLTSPAGPLALFVSKLLVQTVVVLLVATITLAALLLFFDVAGDTVSWPFVLVLFLGGVGVTLVTTLAAALAMHGRNWVLLVPLLSLPSLFPVLAAAVPATGLLLGGGGLETIGPHLRVLVAVDVVFATAAWLLVPFILEP